MKEAIRIFVDHESDKYIFLTIDESKSDIYAAGIIGINYHNGTELIDYSFVKPSIHITEIWRRITLNYPNVDYYFLIKKAIVLYENAFINQKI